MVGAGPGIPCLLFFLMCAPFVARACAVRPGFAGVVEKLRTADPSKSPSGHELLQGNLGLWMKLEALAPAAPGQENQDSQLDQTRGSLPDCSL